MTFDDILAQVQALLQREQRLSYRALQRRFALEEADIEALKDELIYAKRLAVDEDDRVLVWVGDTGTAPASASEALQSAMAQAEHQTERHLLPRPPCCRPISSRGRTPPAHGAVLRPGGLDPPGPAARPGRLARRGAGVPAGLRRGDPAL